MNASICVFIPGLMEISLNRIKQAAAKRTVLCEWN